MPRPLSVALFAAALSLSLAGCGEDPDYERWEATQEESSADGAVAVANADDATDAGEFNQFFPPQADGFDRVFTQEKGGTAIADYEMDEEVMVTLSVTDLTTNPAALNKYETPEFDIDGYPAVTQGSKTTALLVNDRYQVKASGKSDAVSADDRVAWLEKFDLAGLAALDATN